MDFLATSDGPKDECVSCSEVWVSLSSSQMTQRQLPPFQTTPALPALLTHLSWGLPMRTDQPEIQCLSLKVRRQQADTHSSLHEPRAPCQTEVATKGKGIFTLSRAAGVKTQRAPAYCHTLETVRARQQQPSFYLDMGFKSRKPPRPQLSTKAPDGLQQSQHLVQRAILARLLIYSGISA